MASVSDPSTTEPETSIIPLNPLTREHLDIGKPGETPADRNATIGSTNPLPRFFLMENENDGAYISAMAGAEINSFLPIYTIPDAFQPGYSNLAVIKLSWKSGLGIPGEQGNQLRKEWWKHMKNIEKEQSEHSHTESSDEDDSKQEKTSSLLDDVEVEPKNADEAATQLAPQFKRAKCIYRIDSPSDPSNPSSTIRIEHRRAHYLAATAYLSKRKIHKGWKIKLDKDRKWKIEEIDENKLVYKDNKGRVLAEEYRKSSQWGFVGACELVLRGGLEELVGLRSKAVVADAVDFLVSAWIARVAAEVGIFEKQGNA
ncbi:hypothetical protein N0V90_008771 [Kalmusia sp. IMI 367209]|nr:hypothetical protein N0V90_008771 [Kalmusia sp. IMI 367209]